MNHLFRGWGTQYSIFFMVLIYTSLLRHPNLVCRRHAIRLHKKYILLVKETIHSLNNGYHYHGNIMLI